MLRKHLSRSKANIGNNKFELKEKNLLAKNDFHLLISLQYLTASLSLKLEK